MIKTDGDPTIAWARDALNKGGHLGDDVAYVILDELVDVPTETLAETLVSEDPALD